MKDTIVMRCPECGEWLECKKSGIFFKTYEFECPDCGKEWSEEDDSNDQSDAYKNELKIYELHDQALSIDEMSPKSKEKLFKDVDEALSISQQYEDFASEAIAYSLSAFLAYETGDKERAIKCCDESLEIVQDKEFLALKGFVGGVPEDSMEAYSSMILLNNYYASSEPSWFFYTEESVNTRMEELMLGFSEHFLDIPPLRRKYVIFVDDMKHLPTELGKSFILMTNSLPQGLQFVQSGSPVANVLYVKHPFRDNVYITAEDYQYELMKDEVRELKDIMAHLGAKSVEWQQQIENEREGKTAKTLDVNVSTTIKKVGASVGYQNDTETENSHKRMSSICESTQYELQPSVVPYIPKDVVWYRSNMAWQRDCKARLEGRLLHAEFIVSSSTHTFGSESERSKLEVEVNAIIAKANVASKWGKKQELRENSSLTQKFLVTFYPMSEYKCRPSTKSIAAADVVHPYSTKKGGKNWMVLSLLVIIVVLVAVIAFISL